MRLAGCHEQVLIIVLQSKPEKLFISGECGFRSTRHFPSVKLVGNGGCVMYAVWEVRSNEFAKEECTMCRNAVELEGAC